MIQSMIQCPNSSDRVWLRMPTATSGASIYSCRTKEPNKYCLACFSLLTTLLAAFLSFFHKSFTLARITVRIGLSWKRFKHVYYQKRAKKFPPCLREGLTYCATSANCQLLEKCNRDSQKASSLVLLGIEPGSISMGG